MHGGQQRRPSLSGLAQQRAGHAVDRVSTITATPAALPQRASSAACPTATCLSQISKWIRFLINIKLRIVSASPCVPSKGTVWPEPVLDLLASGGS